MSEGTNGGLSFGWGRMIRPHLVILLIQNCQKIRSHGGGGS